MNTRELLSSPYRHFSWSAESTCATFSGMADGFGQQPQFDTAEFKSAGNACAFCKTALSAGYYRVQGKLTCANCLQKIQNSMPTDSHAAYVRALTFGAGGALLGLVLYAGVVSMLHLTIGYLALAVGYIVAKAMMMGSGNIGGRRYQIAAVLFTYAAISISEVVIYAAGVADKVQDYGAFIVKVVLIGLASPILELMESPLNGLIGLVILFVGLSIAWRMTASKYRQLSIEGPY